MQKTKQIEDALDGMIETLSGFTRGEKMHSSIPKDLVNPNKWLSLNECKKWALYLYNFDFGLDYSLLTTTGITENDFIELLTAKIMLSNLVAA